MKVLNPLYAKKDTPETKKQVATARIEAAIPGVCPKCQQPMNTSQLGQSMGNQQVHFCPVCRVASPMSTQEI